MRGCIALQKRFMRNPKRLVDFSRKLVRTARPCAGVLASLSRYFAQHYLHGPGTGITNLPSFSATKFSLVLDELPLPSFFSTLMTSFFVGLRVRQTLPVGPSIGAVAFLTSSGVRLTSSMLEIFSPAPPDCIIL